MPTIEGNLCPACQTTLTASPDTAELDAAPWCGACEWNLDHHPDDRRYAWFARRMERADRQAGFASQRELARSAEPAPVRAGVHRFLVAVSAALLLLLAGLLVGGLWLVAGGGGIWPVGGGLALLLIVLLLRPRFTRLKKLLTRSYRVERTNAPTMFQLIDRIADRLDAPRPDVLLFDFGWNAAVVGIGPRPRRALVLGVPLLLALGPQEVVALVGHEMGHLKYADNRRLVLTAPARTMFGQVARTIRPPLRAPADLGIDPSVAFFVVAWQLIAGTASLLLHAAHLGINRAASRDDRTVELRADAMAAEAAGSAAALRLLDVLAILPTLPEYVQHYVPQGEAAVTWRRMLRSVRERETATVAWRQLSIRRDASLLSSHPAAGRRYQWLTAQPAREAAVVLTEAEAESLEAEIRPYAEALHRTMLKARPDDR
ncbi:M48 family metallopeptidase [Actinoplanes sp. KI2]|uniref:M48 family metallopeptidase n=1 Tax=Actinoplanes sp. KI2 TaxID=2983315 RepID=UPI0021D60D21|nr:M48 family metallopeptidase [Actinoplanes sp. KI2]MCU7729298.1 M48 family metallopeptidase [Actinoplanes sp. KI2]